MTLSLPDKAKDPGAQRCIDRIAQQLPVRANLSIIINVAAASVPNSTLFVDTADSKLKWKDSVGVVNLLY